MVYRRAGKPYVGMPVQVAELMNRSIPKNRTTRYSRNIMGETKPEKPPALYCPQCAREVSDPLTCGDCAAVICRICGTPLESSDELGMG